MARGTRHEGRRRQSVRFTPDFEAAHRLERRRIVLHDPVAHGGGDVGTAAIAGYEQPDRQYAAAGDLCKGTFGRPGRDRGGQAPFIGLPSSILEWCQAPIPSDSPAEAIWQTAQMIVASDAPTDERIQALGLHHLALAAGIHQTVLMPLSAGGHQLGYLQVANKRDGTPFDANDLRFLAIIAGQAAPMIENLTLVQQSRRRALRAETLRRIASLTSSAATLEEILKFSLMDLARLLQVDAAAIFLIDENLALSTCKSVHKSDAHWFISGT